MHRNAEHDVANDCPAEFLGEFGALWRAVMAVFDCSQNICSAG